jgi:hypothetical protein
VKEEEQSIVFIFSTRLSILLFLLSFAVYIHRKYHITQNKKSRHIVCNKKKNDLYSTHRRPPVHRSYYDYPLYKLIEINIFFLSPHVVFVTLLASLSYYETKTKIVTYCLFILEFNINFKKNSKKEIKLPHEGKKTGTK